MAILKDLLVQGIGRVVGKLFLSADPTSDLEAATKHYVDQKSESDVAAIDTTYVKRSGDTMAGVLTMKGNMYNDARDGALNMNNSDIYGANSIYTADSADNAGEGLQFYRDATHVDTLWVSGGDIMFAPNRALGTATSKDNSQKVGRFTANPTTGQAVITDGTTGGLTTRGIRNNTSQGALGWTSAATDTTLATTNTIAYWNGAYQNTSSNIEYVKKGKLGNLAVLDSLGKSDVGLGNVDNTSDINKPISTATQTALDAKADKADITNLEEARIHLVMGTQTATTAAWTGEIDVDELYDGLTILYYLPRTSANNVTLNLTLADGTTTGAKEVYVSGTTRMTTHYGAGSTIMLTYWSAGSVSYNGTATPTDRWTGADYWNSNTIGEYAGPCTAGPNGMARYSLIMKVDDSHWESLVLSSTTAATKTKNTSGFLLDSPILYQSAGTYASGTNAGSTGCWSQYSYGLDVRYSTNVPNTSWSAAGRPFYLVGSISNGKFYLKDTTWWSDALPATDDGYAYWYVGQMHSAYQYTMHPVHPLYKWSNGEWKAFGGNNADYKIISLTGNATSSSTYAKYPYQYTIQWPSAKADTWVDAALLSGDYDGDWAVDTANGSVTMYFETNPTATFGLILEDAHIGAITGITDYQTAINMTQTGTYPDTTLLRQMYQNFQGGCSTIANAITAQGVTTASNASPSVMATNIATVADNKYNEGWEDYKEELQVRPTRNDTIWYNSHKSALTANHANFAAYKYVRKFLVILLDTGASATISDLPTLNIVAYSNAPDDINYIDYNITKLVGNKRLSEVDTSYKSFASGIIYRVTIQQHASDTAPYRLCTMQAVYAATNHSAIGTFIVIEGKAESEWTWSESEYSVDNPS